MDGICGGALPQNDIDGVILHRRVQDLLIGPVQTMDLIDKEDITLVEVGQHRHQVAGLLNGGA